MNKDNRIRPRRPIERVIWEFNGATALAGLLGVHPSAVWQWQGRNRIPSKWQPIILDHAKELDIQITAEDLIG